MQIDIPGQTEESSQSERAWQTERTILSLLTEGDFPAMLELSRETDTFKYLKKLRDMDEEQYQQFLHIKIEQIRSGAGYHWGVQLKTTGEFIAAVNLNPIGKSSRLQIGCQLKKDYWNKGYASELTRWLRDFAVQDLGLPMVYGVFEKENTASRRLLQKLEFEWEETKTENGIEVEFHVFRGFVAR
ncbi:GNAT family N-acetyltransferase [Flavitalea flava]